MRTQHYVLDKLLSLDIGHTVHTGDTISVGSKSAIRAPIGFFQAKVISGSHSDSLCVCCRSFLRHVVVAAGRCLAP